MKKRKPDPTSGSQVMVERDTPIPILQQSAREEYVVTLRVLPAPVAGIYRIRRVLKLALRAFALRCISIRTATGKEEKP